MTISVKAIVYHRKNQIRDIERIASEMTPGSNLHVITSEKHAKKLRSDISQRNQDCTRTNIHENRAPLHPDYEVIRDINIMIHTPKDEHELISYLGTKLRETAESEDIDSVVLEIDMSCAAPWESVAVCKLSAAINVRMYTSRSGHNHIKSFPKHLDLDESELVILRQFRGRKNFTRDDVAKALGENGLSASTSTVHRVISSLDYKGCIQELRGNEYPGERSTHGGNRQKYYTVVDDSWMMERIHDRAVGKLGESVRSSVPGDKEDESDDWRVDSNP